MSVVYFDSSALVKLVVEEVGTDLAVALWDGCTAAVASRVAYPEVRAALAAAGRNHELSVRDVRSAERAWDAYWSTVRPVELTAAVEQHAGALAGLHGLRGADAVHLASALALDGVAPVFAAWDRRLRSGVVATGLAVAPAELPA